MFATIILILFISFANSELIELFQILNQNGYVIVPGETVPIINDYNVEVLHVEDMQILQKVNYILEENLLKQQNLTTSKGIYRMLNDTSQQTNERLMKIKEKMKMVAN